MAWTPGNNPSQGEPQWDWQTRKPQFELGRVLSRTFSAIVNNWLKFLLLSVLISGLPMFLVGLWPIIIMGGEGIMSENTANSGAMAGVFVASVLGFVLFIVASVLLQSILVHACFKDFAGEDVSLRQSFKIAMSFLLPLIGLTILYMLGVGFGFILLVIPGISLLLGWYLAVPVMLFEQTSVTDSLSRSWELTKGYKRWILLILVIISVISMIISTVLTLGSIPFGDPNTAIFTGGTVTFWIIYSFMSALGQSISVLLNASAVAALYYEIRDLKEGIIPETIAAVFD
jgi:membrane-anchored glycerophosphoryl diester phosphodiesterase (GDPDase)